MAAVQKRNRNTRQVITAAASFQLQLLLRLFHHLHHMAHGTPSNAQQYSRNQASQSVAGYRLPGCRSKNSPAAGGWYVGRTSLVITWEGTGQGSVRASSENETESKENKSFGPRTLRLRHGAYRMGRHDASQGPCGSGGWKMMIVLMVGCGDDVGIVIESNSLPVWHARASWRDAPWTRIALRKDGTVQVFSLPPLSRPSVRACPCRVRERITPFASCKTRRKRKGE
ncbi:uncharacterized protein J3D65DRAFT_302294 [Phyllosticta citribraziliensis]|uniref:Uncharacterized protein n=1 Tax=Phyllosticta citribraziliensis TaxID=989973 RepID=A0ABR1M0R9_9PEZI